jgi:hypothetical protein
MFFPTNSFSGEGRFVSRYLIDERSNLPTQKKQDDVVDVQLALPLHDSRMFVRPLYGVGCGFESRYRYDFEQWIDPSEIEMEAQNGSIRYWHAPTQRLMRIRYLGFFRSEFLTPEYALLLLHHADSYTNPFSAVPSAKEEQTSLGRIYRVPALVFGKISLRREEIRVPVPVLDKVLTGSDFLTAAVRLRDTLHFLTASRTDEWYFRTTRVSKAGLKPRYLDLRNPIGSQLLSREVASLEKNAVVSFSRMDPPIEHIRPIDGHRYTTEHMIEV